MLALEIKLRRHAKQRCPQQQLKACLDASCLPAGGGGSSSCPDGGSSGGEHGTGAAADAG